MIWSVKQACTRNLSTYVHNKTDPDLCAGAHTHGAVYEGGPCKCVCMHLVFKRKKQREEDCSRKTCCLQFSSSQLSLVSGLGRWERLSRTDTVHWIVRLRNGWEPLLGVSPFLGKSKANPSLSTVPKQQLQSGAMMTSVAFAII